jgi:hypothetical protein
MLAGRALKDARGGVFFWQDRGSEGTGFWTQNSDGNFTSVTDFSGLYSQEAQA